MRIQKPAKMNTRARKLAFVSAALVAATLGGLGAPADAAMARPSFQEMCGLLDGHYYNTPWGELCHVDGNYIWAD